MPSLTQSHLYFSVTQVQYADEPISDEEEAPPQSDDGIEERPMSARQKESLTAPGAVARAALRMPAPPDEEQVCVLIGVTHA